MLRVTKITYNIVIGILVLAGIVATSDSALAVRCVCTQLGSPDVGKECSDSCSDSACGYTESPSTSCTPVEADSGSGDNNSGSGDNNSGSGDADSGSSADRPTFGHGYKYLINPLTGRSDQGDPTALFMTVIASVIRTVLGLAGAFAMLGFVWGGVTWMTSYGSDQKVTRGRQMMVWSGFGLIVLFSSYAVVTFLFSALGII